MSQTLGWPGSDRCGYLQFADSRTAYDDLSQEKKQEIENLIANHSLFHSRKTAVPEYFKDTDPSKLPLSKHKLAQVHEWSGRKVSVPMAPPRNSGDQVRETD